MTGLKPIKFRTAFRGAAVGLPQKVQGSLTLVHMIFSWQMRTRVGVLNLLLVMWPVESNPHAEPVCLAEGGNTLALVTKALHHYLLTWRTACKARQAGKASSHLPAKHQKIISLNIPGLFNRGMKSSQAPSPHPSFFMIFVHMEPSLGRWTALPYNCFAFWFFYTSIPLKRLHCLFLRGKLSACLPVHTSKNLKNPEISKRA